MRGTTLRSIARGSRRLAAAHAAQLPGARGRGPFPSHLALSSPAFASSMPGRFWLFKSEPEPRIVKGIDVSYGIDKLQADGEADWDGVRNYQARNNMMAMSKGDMALYYHSNTKVPGVVGTCEVVRESYPDETAFDPEDPHFDPKSSEDKPRWFKVDIAYRSRTPRKVSLAELKADPALQQMQLFTRARLSVCELTEEEYNHVLSLAETPEPEAIAAARPKPRAPKGEPKSAAAAAAAASTGPAASAAAAARPAATSSASKPRLSKQASAKRGSAAAARTTKGRAAGFAAFAAAERPAVEAALGQGANARSVSKELAARWEALSDAERAKLS
ncbi:hypothetical protein FNF27_07088 [Cafeteria roenbergensis]|uniref:Thymocyte nuclear protein 1 n=1 Tax=Cafeteria roenbergensis TaxID=33653 RepID=A0A5A8DU64_CAFRO|nr:hypothetical protein FNF27_07088 [Cafeteria roenbergensis]